MDKTQYLVFELGEHCNLGRRHRKCPNCSPRRFTGLDTSRVLNDNMIVSIVSSMYQHCGFEGMVAFHYYNEPTAQGYRMARLMRRIRARARSARFALWTNGTLLEGQADALAEDFAHIRVTDYSNMGSPPIALHALREACRRTGAEFQVGMAALDERLQPPTREGDAPCGRMYLERIWDCHGYQRLCCFAWSGSAALSNVFDVTLEQQNTEWLDIRRQLSTNGRMLDTAPQVCRECRMRHRTVEPLAPSLLPIAARANQCLRTGGAPAAEVEPPEQTVPVVVTKVRKVCRIPHWGELNTNYKQVRRQIASGNPGPTGKSDLYAVIGTWHEGDVIEALVKHCLHQGCDRVLLVDNASPDDTAEIARAAGAEVVDVYHTDHYLEGERLWRMNRAMERFMRVRRRVRPSWWLFIDGDEFVQPRGGLRLKEYVEQLPSNVEVVSAVAFDLYPTHDPAYVEGTHPADRMPYGMERNFCGSRRSMPWKTPLVRLDESPPSLCFTRGMHEPYALWPKRQRVLAHPETLIIHHCPFREEAATRKRLEALCGTRPTGDHRSITDDLAIGAEGAIKRWRALDAVYSRQWDKVEIPHAQAYKSRSVVLRHWSEVFSEEDYQPQRWY